MTEPAHTDAARYVSVIVPTHNRPAMLRQALASIRAIEGPDLVFEILIGDNGGAPDTAAIAEEFGAIHFKTKRPGAAGARNAAFAAATGGYVAFLDDDDIWLPENIRPHLAQLKAHPELLAVIGQFIYVDEKLKPTSSPTPASTPGEGDEMLRAMLGGWFPQVATTVARISVRDRVGLFDEGHAQAEDVDWFLRLGRTRAVGFQPTACMLFRGRPSGTFDKINRARVKAGRRVFLKHALGEWRIWRSPAEFLRSYRARLDHFYVYFSEGAKAHLRAGRYGAAIIGMMDAAYVFPIRAAVRLLIPGSLRRYQRPGFQS